MENYDQLIPRKALLDRYAIAAIGACIEYVAARCSSMNSVPDLAAKMAYEVAHAMLRHSGH